VGLFYDVSDANDKRSGNSKRGFAILSQSSLGVGMDRTRLDISWSSLFRVLVIGLAIYAAFLMRETISILILALVISTALEPGVDRLEKMKIPRILGTIIIFLVALTILAFVVYTILPITLLELNSLFNNLGGLAEQFLGISSPAQITNFIDTDLSNLTNLLLSGGVPFLQVLGKLLGSVAYAIAVLVLSFYLTISRDGVEKFIKSILPEGAEARALQIYRTTRRKIGRWFQAQIVLSLVIGTAVFIGLWIIGIKQNLVLAVIAAVFELVPVVGPIFAGALAVAVSAGESLRLGLYVLFLFLAIQQIENQLLVPLVMKRAVGINPVIILIALLGGAQIAGVIGMLVAIPTAVLLQEILNGWVEVKSSRSSKGKQ